MKSILSFQKVVSYVSIGVFFLVTIVFLTSYTSMKRDRATTGRLYWIANFLAEEKAATNEYPYDLECYEYRTIDGWKNQLIYECIDDGKDYALFSTGKDGIPYTEDDIHAEKHDFSKGY